MRRWVCEVTLWYGLNLSVGAIWTVLSCDMEEIHVAILLVWQVLLDRA